MCSCDLASRLNYVTGDEVAIDVLIALFRNQSTCVVCVDIFFIKIMSHTDLVTVPQSTSINYILQQEDTTVVKKFQHILG